MSDRPLQLMLVDEDPVFRLGLKVWLEQQGDFAVAAEADSAATALSELRSRFSKASSRSQAGNAQPAKFPRFPNLLNPQTPSLSPLDLVILDLGVGSQSPDRLPGLQLCQQIKTDFPSLPVLVLSAQTEPVLQSAAERMGANGFGSRSMSVRQLAQLIRQVASQPKGQSDDPASRDSATAADTPPSVTPPSFISASPTPLPEPSIRLNNRVNAIPGPLTAMRISMRLSGLQQIDQQLTELAQNRRQARSWFDQAVLDGRKRELIAARWLVATLWRTPQFSDRPRRNRFNNRAGDRTGIDTPLQGDTGRGTTARQPSTDWLKMAQQSANSGRYGDLTAASYLDRAALVPGATAALAAIEARLQARPGDVQSVVFEGVFAKLQRPLNNLSAHPLEIDILRPDKKLELLYLVLRQLEELLADLRASTVQPGQLPIRANQVLQDLWAAVNTEFFGKYYTVRIGTVEEEVVTLLQQEQPLVQAQILNRIPLVPALLSHWLFQEPLTIEGEPYLATTPEAIAYSETLLENLMIQVANAVMQPLLNRLADSEPIKKSLYTGRLMSSREIERFRNDLSWRYRWVWFIDEPKAIFESRYNLYNLTPQGIALSAVYAPRRGELNQLTGIPLVVTLAMETRDAIAPRVQTVISLLGSSVVYVLTEILGRGIGLVGRGILRGVGNAWQDKQEPRVPPGQTRSRRYRNTYAEDPYRQDFNEWE